MIMQQWCKQGVVGCRYEDDRDEGEWFLYTGSGGRDLSGNKRVNKVRCSMLFLPTFRDR